MELEVLVSFKQIDQNLRDFQFERIVFRTTEELKHIIYVHIKYVKNGVSTSVYRGYALKEIFDTNYLYYLNFGIDSTYFYLLGDDTKFQIFEATDAKIPVSRFPYRLIKETYNVSTQKIKFAPPVPDEESSRIAKQLKYTFGIEFETCCGVIPEDMCLDLRLVPLRDGSIGGVEYATVPLNNKNIGLLKKQVECLKTYTTFDKTCSMHIHFGRLPHDIKYYYLVYKVFYSVQNELMALLPKYTFHTDIYKENGKNYCNPLIAYESIADWYFDISNGLVLDKTQTEVNLTQPHPNDLEGRQKWHINSRYSAVNFVNALFYNRNKTIEFRFLKPSYNIHYIINWLYLLTSILKTAELIFNVNGIKDKNLFETDLFCKDFFGKSDVEQHINLYSCITTAFDNSTIHRQLSIFLNNIRTITKLQSCVKDFIGLKTQFHDLYIKTDPIDQQ